MEIINPILKGFNPDPSICRVENDYYIATSTFEWFPGVQIHHSRDLVNWRLLHRPLNRLSQLDMRGNPDSCGVWAPNLSYHNGLFWLVYSNVRCFDGRWKDLNNYLVISPVINGEWSEPIYLNSSGFDASLFHDDDGRVWLANLLVDHRGGKFFGGIILQEYSYSLQKLVGEVYHIFEGSPLGITEGPLIHKHDGWYYLITAEGGTEYNHAVSVARSRTITGPYEIHPGNPILTSSDDPELELQKAGHGSIVETQNGEWFMAHLAGRPLTQRGRCVLGRETALQRVEWRDGWLWLEGGGRHPKVQLAAPRLPVYEFGQTDAFCDDFNEDYLDIRYQSLRIPIDSSWLSLKRRKGFLSLRGRESLCSTHFQSTIAFRQNSFRFQAVAKLNFLPENFQQMAGICYYYNTRHFYYFYMSWCEIASSYVLNVLVNDDNNWSEPVALIQINSHEVELKITVDHSDLSFEYRIAGGDWTSVVGGLDASIISDDYVQNKHEYKAAFTGAFIGLCCQDLSNREIWASFDKFEYKTY